MGIATKWRPLWFYITEIPIFINRNKWSGWEVDGRTKLQFLCHNFNLLFYHINKTLSTGFKQVNDIQNYTDSFHFLYLNYLKDFILNTLPGGRGKCTCTAEWIRSKWSFNSDSHCFSLKLSCSIFPLRLSTEIVLYHVVEFFQPGDIPN